jgi:hypothetical protein
VRLQLVDGVPSLQLGQSEARDEIAPPQDPEAQVEQEEEERGARAECRDDEDRRDDEKRQAAQDVQGRLPPGRTPLA